MWIFPGLGQGSFRLAVHNSPIDGQLTANLIAFHAVTNISPRLAPMPSTIPVARTIPALRRAIAGFRSAGETVALVPTMGALHAGHLALVRRAGHQADRVVVSIFVNPAQFAPHEDLASYPRRMRRDIAALAQYRVDLVWAPPVNVMYPERLRDSDRAAGSRRQRRPGRCVSRAFFSGVATVVTKLLTQCMPDAAVFRREGLSAAPGGHAAGTRSQYPGKNHQRAHRPGERRPRSVFA